jgi:class 3 adenylate cyclase
VYVGVTAGLVTLLFTDIEGGVRWWEADRDAVAAVSARHDRMVRELVEAAGGRVFQAVGEAHRAVFADPVAALSAAVAIQRAAGAEPWPAGLPVRCAWRRMLVPARNAAGIMPARW